MVVKEQFSSKNYSIKNQKIFFLIFLFALDLIIILKLNFKKSFISTLTHINNKKFFDEIQKIYSKFNKVNINTIDNKINGNKKSDTKINSIINIGLIFDKNYVYETIVTVASIMATQKKLPWSDFILV